MKNSLDIDEIPITKILESFLFDYYNNYSNETWFDKSKYIREYFDQDSIRDAFLKIWYFATVLEESYAKDALYDQLDIFAYAENDETSKIIQYCVSNFKTYEKAKQALQLKVFW